MSIMNDDDSRIASLPHPMDASAPSVTHGNPAMSTPPPDPPSDPKPFAFSPQDAMTFMQKMWNPFGVPMPGFAMPGTSAAATGAGALPFPNPASLFATLDPAEVGRKIDELKVIEGWLQMTLSVMQMSIKTMELQKASLEAMRGAQVPPAKAASKRAKS
jgi:hypothetical protein